MEFGEILRYVLMGAGALALIALFVALVRLAGTLGTINKTITDPLQSLYSEIMPKDPENK